MLKEIFISGKNIRYFEEGEGSPIIIIHGWGSWSGLPQVKLRELLVLRGYRVIFLILPGFGSDYFPSNGWGIENYAECIEEFIKQKNLEEVFLIGHSMGGAISIRAAISRPKKIRALFLLSPAIFSLAGSNWKQRLFAIGFHGFLTALAIGKFMLLLLSAVLRPLAFLARWFGKILKSAEQWLDGIVIQHRFYTQEKIRMGKIFKRIIKNENIIHYLADVRQPVLVIWGEKDFNFYFSAPFSGRIPNYEFKIIPGVGHNLPEQAPEKVVELIIDFIKKLEKNKESRS